MRSPGKMRLAEQRCLSQLAAMVVSVVVGGATLAGCVSPRNALGTTTGPCFLALPAASHTVSEKGKLVGVRSFTTASLASKLRSHAEAISRSRRRSLSAQAQAQVQVQVQAELTLAERLRTGPSRNLCAVAYQGPYSPGEVKGANSSASGEYAVVVVPENGGAPIVAFVARRLPFGFRHF